MSIPEKFLEKFIKLYTFYSKRYKMTTVTTRVPEPMLKEIDMFSRKKHIDRSTLLRNLIARGLEIERKERALELYRQHKITLQKMASLLEITYLDALEIIKEENLHLDYGLDELKEDLRGLQ